MRQYIVPVLLLTIVALSSSNVLPMSVNDLNREQLSFDSQHNDNTFSDRYQTRNVIDEIYKLYVAHDDKPGSNKLQLKYADADNNQNDDIFNIISKDDNYNGEGFRKEQWHNYPRQLDRLHQLYEHNTDKRNFDPDPNKEYTEEVAPDNQEVNDKPNEIYLDSNTATDNVYDAVMAATNPLLILKMRLASLNKDIDNANAQYANLINLRLGSNNLREDEKNEFRNENPEVNVMKVKREGVASTQTDLSENRTQNKAVNKRIFSLWSRLQSLNHKGHELQHRRHLHAFYGLPDSDGGGALTAETRATLMRPPGSPLRWG
ncbi:hypothetical protein PYW08_013909 [Mythimna loreyi]|uniref:Uncharacterized protein n=1 Tax=Mythimna loreyi TaxID=667449 RepID=A0ACC2R6V3_9NEOP|nr:hypothetical protein PYW08_013909 [Mythimna loreyi]